MVLYIVTTVNNLPVQYGEFANTKQFHDFPYIGNKTPVWRQIKAKPAIPIISGGVS